VAGCGGAAASGDPSVAATTLWGAGTPVEYPIYEEAGSELIAQGLMLNYQQAGPAAAVSDLRAGRLAFMATDGGGGRDAPPHRGGTGAESVPVARWAVAVIYNLPSVKGRVRLDGRTLADMYRGAITNWDSREIARLNPGLRLPAIPVRVVHRADGDAATALLTGYMAAGSPRWRRAVGSGTAVRWPGGTAVNDDEAMVATVNQNPGAIGYTEQTAVLLNGLSSFALRNAAGRFVAPTPTAASTGAYPVVVQAYLLMYRDLCAGGLTPRQANATRNLATWLLAPAGQALVKRLWFSPLPNTVRARAQGQVTRLLCDSQPIT
jgi:phosphate transport system substrate-binding protein